VTPPSLPEVTPAAANLREYEHMAISQKIQMLLTFRLLLSGNGFLWTAHAVPYILIRSVFKHCRIPILDRRMKQLEKKYNLPGINCAEINYSIWKNWDWERKAGEEWTLSEEWKQSLINDVMLKYIERDKSVLEIGPGAGRWTETLQKISKDVTIVDISDRCIEICKKRFSQCDNITYFVTGGSNLDFIPGETIDFVWSHDVFVHINPEDTERYLEEFSRILRKGGRGIIHHSKDGGLHGGWRSSMTDELFVKLLSKYGLSLVTQFDSWGKNGEFDVHYYHDTFTVFEK
jgi:ubiquinone/menaquinone biosynthesis C-methylase UbiE